VASIITQRSGSRVGVVNVAMQCSIGFIYGKDGYVSIYEYEGTNNGSWSCYLYVQESCH